MSILVINSGSTSLKYKLFNEQEKEVGSGNFTEIKNTEQAIKMALREINDLQNISAVGHRIVHGGDKFIKPTLINSEILTELEKFNNLAPLHNPYNIAGIKAVSAFLPDIPQAAIFDTAFYASLPAVARTYAIPEEIAEKYKIRRYGFHGISYEFTTCEAARQLKIEVSKINLISCHLGGGWSITAIKGGKPLDTSMGWTPLEGLVMMSRSGDLDPAIVIELLKKSNRFSIEEKCNDVYSLLNHQSGLRGLAGGISDYQELLKEMSLGNEKAKLAFEVAIYRLSKYIGAYWAVLGGEVNALVFTGAIGSGNPITRNRVMAKLKFLNKIPVLSIKPNEELMIARETKRLINH